jgi:hypothetical protein
MTNLCYSLDLFSPFNTETRRRDVLVYRSIPTFLRDQTGILAKRATLRPGQQVSTKQSPDDLFDDLPRQKLYLFHSICICKIYKPSRYQLNPHSLKEMPGVFLRHCVGIQELSRHGYMYCIHHVSSCLQHISAPRSLRNGGGSSETQTHLIEIALLFIPFFEKNHVSTTAAFTVTFLGPTNTVEIGRVWLVIGVAVSQHFTGPTWARLSGAFPVPGE